jgi:hypothetical protein
MVYSIDILIEETRKLSTAYRETTGKPLPVSGEIAKHDACRLLSLECVDEFLGYDAIDEKGLRYLIKGRAIFNNQKSGQRIGQLKMDKQWDVLLLVLMDECFTCLQVYRLDRETVQKSLREGNPNKRGAISVAKFKIIGELLWSSENEKNEE